MKIKRSKSANMLPSPLDPPESQYFPVADAIGEDSSGEEARETAELRADELAKTKAARAQSEHRRRVELKESVERLRMTLGVPQPRAGKKDLVEQANLALEYYKRKEGELMQEIQFLKGQQQK